MRFISWAKWSKANTGEKGWRMMAQSHIHRTQYCRAERNKTRSSGGKERRVGSRPRPGPLSVSKEETVHVCVSGRRTEMIR